MSYPLAKLKSTRRKALPDIFRTPQPIQKKIHQKYRPTPFFRNKKTLQTVKQSDQLFKPREKRVPSLPNLPSEPRPNKSIFQKNEQVSRNLKREYGSLLNLERQPVEFFIQLKKLDQVQKKLKS